MRTIELLLATAVCLALLLSPVAAFSMPFSMPLSGHKTTAPVSVANKSTLSALPLGSLNFLQSPSGKLSGLMSLNPTTSSGQYGWSKLRNMTSFHFPGFGQSLTGTASGLSSIGSHGLSSLLAGFPALKK